MPHIISRSSSLVYRATEEGEVRWSLIVVVVTVQRVIDA